MACLSIEDVALYVGGSSAEADRLRTVALHVESCETCREHVVAAVRAARSSRPRIDIDAGISVGTRIGRYRVTAIRGSGAMGHVFEAEDSDLGRTIALKVVRNPDSDGDARALREGRALARLAHPHVVTVYDVGTWEGGVFLAMELVDGISLRDWVKHRRSWREVVRTIAVVARALDAAHRQGLVHRDVKPDNLIVDKDGRVRVIDFGLATENADDQQIGGTPAYMAPEQKHELRADARSDQFALFTTLYELLEGQRPGPHPVFAARIPAALRAAIRRGLQSSPANRFPDLAAAASALERVLGRRRRIAVVSGALASLTVVATAAVAFSRPDESCTGARDALAGIWDSKRERAIGAVFTSFDLPYADAVWRTTSRQLTAYADAWVAMRTDACKATHVRHEQSAELLDLRVECLRGRAAQLRAITDLFATTRNPRTVENAVALAGSLPTLDDCANRELLTSPVKMPTDPIGRARVVMLKEELARAELVRDSGRNARALMDRIVADARAVGHLPTLARALLQVGAVESGSNPAGATAAIREGLRVAEEARDDAARADGTIALVGLIAKHFKTGEDVARARELAKDGEAAIKRIGGDPLRRGRLAMNLAIVLRMGDKAAESLAEHERALAFLQQGHANPVALATQEATMAIAIQDLGDYDRAAKGLQHARAVLESALGPAHPKIAILLDLESEVRNNQGQPTEAKALLDRAFAISDKLDDFDSAPQLIHLAQTYGGLGNYEQQLATAERALTHYLKTDGEESFNTAGALEYIGTAQKALGRLDLATITFKRVLAIRIKIFGRDDSDVAQSHRSLGGVALAKRDFRSARERYAEALRIDEIAAAGSNLRLVVDLIGIAHSELGLKRFSAAIAAAERARSLCTADVEPSQRAQAELALARAVWQSGGDRARARQLARDARASATASKLFIAKATLAEIDEWLAAHP